MAERIFTREDAKSLIRTNTRSLKIPSDYTAIASGALAGFSQLEDLVIPEGITKISSYAFYVRSFKNTSNLKSLTLPSSLRQFDRWCFFDLNALESINVPEDFSEPLAMELFFQCPEATINFGKKLNIGKKVLFASKTKTVQHIMDEVGGILTLVSASTLKVDDDWTLIIPPTFKVILTHAMRGVANKNVKRIVIPKTIKIISSKAFSFITTAEELVVEEGVEYIDSGAFAGCKGLKKITLPSSLKKIGAGAFMNLPHLEKITLPPDLEEISDEMFSGCTSLRKVRFGKKITKIGAGAFAGCTGLRGMILPDSVKTIGNSAFWECLSLQRLYIPPACESLTQSSLGNCPLLTTLYMPRIIHDQQQTKRIFGDLTNPTITWVDEGSEPPVWHDSELPDPEDIASEQFILLSEDNDPILYMQVMNYCRTHRFTPRVAGTFEDISSVLLSVSAGLGISILPSALAEAAPSVSVQPLPEEYALDCIAAWKPSLLNPAASLFLEILKG